MGTDYITDSLLYDLHTASIIDVLWSTFMNKRSIYRRYGHNTFETLSYYMANNRIIWSHIGYIRSVL